MAVPFPASNDVVSWKTHLKRLARSFRHRQPTAGIAGENFLIFMCVVKFVAVYPQLSYRFQFFAWPVNGYSTWINTLAKVLAQGGATQITGDLLSAFETLCLGCDASRYSG